MADRSLATVWRFAIALPMMDHKTDLLGVPLASLPAIVLDTETTGLDPSQDKVIEIGAVRLPCTDVDAAEQFQTRVNPNRAIPPEATEIHGLADADVSGAPEFSQAFASFKAWSNEGVIIGYAIAFDLAILRSECEGADVAWHVPQSLDLRQLLRIIEPEPIADSLEAAAERFGIAVVDRHRALGDALLTARIFNAAVPKLRAKGIRTFGEANNAIRARIARRERLAHGEPAAITAAPTGEGQGFAGFPRLDSFPYRHRISELMSAPVVAVGAGERLGTALQTMMSRRISSIFVRLADTGHDHDHGIITGRDVLRAIADFGASALDQPVANFAKRPLVSVHGHDFVYVALARMAQHHIRHLAVVDDAGAIVGALSARDLLGQRAEDAIALGRMIEQAATPEELGQVWMLLPRVAKALIAEDVDPRDIASVISRELRALTRKACELAYDELAPSGDGAIPAHFAVMVLGSGGRGESLLAMDQDNAIVYEASDASVGPDVWLERFAKRFSDILDAVGVAYCNGGVMASNAAWRKDATAWRETVRGWMLQPRPQDILNCDIFFDAAPVYGERELADTLRADAIAFAKGSRSFLSLLALNASSAPPAFSWLGHFKTERDRIDLKRAGIMPIFSAARVLALRHGLTERSTRERLEAFQQRDAANAELASDLIESHRICLACVLRQQLRDLDRGIKIGNSVAPAELGRLERGELKWALRRVPSISSILGTPVEVM